MSTGSPGPGRQPSGLARSPLRLHPLQVVLKPAGSGDVVPCGKRRCRKSVRPLGTVIVRKSPLRHLKRSGLSHELRSHGQQGSAELRTQTCRALPEVSCSGKHCKRAGTQSAFTNVHVMPSPGLKRVERTFWCDGYMGWAQTLWSGAGLPALEGSEE